MSSSISTKSLPEIPMSQTKRVSPSQNDTTRRVKRSKNLRNWFCYQCGHGPMNSKIDAACTGCGNRRCSFCSEERVPIKKKLGHDISPPQNREPSRCAALPATSSQVPHSNSKSATRAATPLDNTENGISNLGLTSLSPVPYLLQQTRVLGTGTITATSTQSESPSRQTNILASERWHGGGCEHDLVQVHVHGDIHDLFLSTGATSTEDTGSRLPNGLPQLVSDSGVDYSIHPRNETAGSSLGTLQKTQSHQVEQVIPISASATNSERQSIQEHTIPIVPGEIVLDSLLRECSAFSVDASIQLSPDSEGQNNSIEPALLWGLDDDYTIPLLQPQLPLIDYELPEPPPSSATSPNFPNISKGDRAVKGASRNYDCCEPGGSQRLACLFYKHDPRQYVDCMLKSFNTIGHLRQHLNQSHKLGPNHCTSCWRTFNTVDSLSNHNTTQCVPTGGVPVDDLPVFPRMRSPPDKKWFWGWKKLFGEAAAPPKCPYFHPLEDLTAQFQAGEPDPSNPKCLGGDWIGIKESSSYPSYVEEASLSTSPDWQFVDDEKLLNITDGIAGLLPEDLSMSSSYPSTNLSPSTQSWDFDFET
ncbi:hypothetical protein F4803DRAFT_545753 [Xylaria telfairii]|nr:hypothetical protein F4803DRAFT_545753 [Xylaria telfairii]